MKLSALALLMVALLLPAADAAATTRRSVAVVAAREGDAGIEGRPQRALRVREWVEPGDVLTLARNARLVLVFRSGRRFEARGAGGVRVRSESMEGRAVRELEALPPWPPHVQPADLRNTHPAAVRLRAGAIEGLNPGEGGVVLADEARLSFTPETGASEYAFEVRDARGQPVFQTRARGPEVRLPANTLEPGRAYVWSVTAVEPTGEHVTGEAGFRTLDVATAAARGRIAECVDSPEAKVYLDELDQALGLVRDDARR